MSQGSIEHYVADGEKEAIEERRRLALQESERKQFANAIISQGSLNHDEAKQGPSAGQNNLTFNFGKPAPKGRFGRKEDSSTKQERLTELLSKTAQYTRFILQQNLAHHKAQSK